MLTNKSGIVEKLTPIRTCVGKWFLPGNDPDFIIIGAQKSGTSSLYYYLNQHPKIVGSSPKEVHFYDQFVNYPGKDLNWYRKHFTTFYGRSNKSFFEATPAYIYHEEAAKKIKNDYPGIKLLLLLRDPVERAYSAWNMYKYIFVRGIGEKLLSHGRYPNEENLVYKHLMKGRTQFPSLREVMDIEYRLMSVGEDREPAILRRGMYFDQLTGYLKYFDLSQIMIIGFRDLSSDPVKTCNTVCDFLGLDAMPGSFDSVARNARAYESPLPQNDKEALAAFYKEPNLRLLSLLGYELNW